VDLKAGTNVTLTQTGQTIEVASTSGGTPGGADTQVQFNDAGAFGGDAGLTYNKTTDYAALAGGLISPNIVGGTATTSDLYLKTTTGVGAAGADMHFLVGNNGTTEAMTILNSGNVGIGTASPVAKFHISHDGWTVINSENSRAGDFNALLAVASNAAGTPNINLRTSNNKEWYFRHIGGTNEFELWHYRADSTNWDEWIEITPAGHAKGETFQILRGSVGIGTTEPNSKLQIGGSIALPLTTKTAAYTLTSNDYTVLGDATGAAFNLSLPTAVGITGRIYILKKIDSTANAVTVDPSGTETIDGAATVSLALQWSRITIQSDGANWQRLD
jgi:hypothetical protein